MIFFPNRDLAQVADVSNTALSPATIENIVSLVLIFVLQEYNTYCRILFTLSLTSLEYPIRSMMFGCRNRGNWKKMDSSFDRNNTHKKFFKRKRLCYFVNDADLRCH